MAELDETIGSCPYQDQYAYCNGYNPPGKWPFRRHRSGYYEFDRRPFAEIIIGIGQVYHIQPEGVISGWHTGWNDKLNDVLLAFAGGEFAFSLSLHPQPRFRAGWLDYQVGASSDGVTRRIGNRKGSLSLTIVVQQNCIACSRDGKWTCHNYSLRSYFT